jgi:formylglycine-generating enzyme required for sulfatase activity/class 3 adenylate cyclase
MGASASPNDMPGEVHRFGQGKSEYRSPEGLARRLAAIIAADIAGYSRLMGADEEGTHARVTRHRRELIDPTIAEHHGRVVKNTGDGFIAMFDSPVEAVRCAIVIQQSVMGRNAALPEQQRILYRIGVNLGDVIVEPEDIYGDGVNIAARLEGIAEPGAVYISGGVYEQIKNKLVCGYKPLGDKRVKNITDPVSVYRVLPDPAAVKAARQVRWLASALAIVLVLALGVGAGAFWVFSRGESEKRAAQPVQSLAAVAPSAPAVTGGQPAAASTAAAPATSVPPSAVMPRGAGEPEMVLLPGGSFAMGSNEDPTEKPIHRVTVKRFAIGKYPVTVREWKACVAAKACAPDVTGAADDDRPVANVSWADAEQYARWLAQTTRKAYRLPSEAEWEYAARGNTDGRFWWGTVLISGKANCKGCGDPYDAAQPLKVGQFSPNPFGLYDMGGGVAQWVADCYHRDFAGAPSDGAPWIGGDCFTHVLKGGSWRNDPSYVRPASRDQYDTAVRYPTHGFRLALSE